MCLQWWLSCSQPCLPQPLGTPAMVKMQLLWLVMSWVMKETAPISLHLPACGQPEPLVQSSTGCLSVTPLGPQKLCPHHGAGHSRVPGAVLGSWILKIWLGWDKLQPIPTECGSSSLVSGQRLSPCSCSTAGSNRAPQQLASP